MCSNWIGEILYVRYKNVPSAVMSTDAAAASHQYIMLPVAVATSRSPPSAMEPSGSWSQKRKESLPKWKRNHQEYEEYKEHERFVTNLTSIAHKNE